MKMKFYYVIRENKMSTASDAPYLGAFESNGTVNEDSLIRGMLAAGCKVDAETIRMVLRAKEAILIELAPLGIQVEDGLVTYGPEITGSFDTIDAPVDPARNELVFGATLAPELRNALKDVELILDKEASADARVAVKFVFTPELGRDGNNTVKGKVGFRVYGQGLILNDPETDTVVLPDKNGVEHDVTAETDTGNSILCSALSDLPVGKGVVTVRSAGGVEGGAVMSSSRNVTVIAGDPPPPAPTMTVESAASGGTPWTIHGPSGSGMFHMSGANIVFTDSADEGVFFTYVNDDGETVVKHAGADKITQSDPPGTAPWVWDEDLVGGDGNPPHAITGTLKIASRAGVPGSVLQVFEHSCDWKEE